MHLLTTAGPPACPEALQASRQALGWPGCWPGNAWSRATALTGYAANGPGPGNAISSLTGCSSGISRTTPWCRRAPEPMPTCSANDASLRSVARYRHSPFGIIIKSMLYRICRRRHTRQTTPDHARRQNHCAKLRRAICCTITICSTENATMSGPSLAVGVGFEPTVRLRVQRFSRPPRSTTPAPHR